MKPFISTLFAMVAVLAVTASATAAEENENSGEKSIWEIAFPEDTDDMSAFGQEIIGGVEAVLSGGMYALGNLIHADTYRSTSHIRRNLEGINLANLSESEETFSRAYLQNVAIEDALQRTLRARTYNMESPTIKDFQKAVALIKDDRLVPHGTADRISRNQLGEFRIFNPGTRFRDILLSRDYKTLESFGLTRGLTIPHHFDNHLLKAFEDNLQSIIDDERYTSSARFLAVLEQDVNGHKSFIVRSHTNGVRIAGALKGLGLVGIVDGTIRFIAAYNGRSPGALPALGGFSNLAFASYERVKHSINTDAETVSNEVASPQRTTIAGAE